MLTEVLVLEIRASYQRGVRGRSIGALAKRFGVSPGTILDIVKDLAMTSALGYDSPWPDASYGGYPALGWLGREG